MSIIIMENKDCHNGICHKRNITLNHQIPAPLQPQAQQGHKVIPPVFPKNEVINSIDVPHNKEISNGITSSKTQDNGLNNEINYNRSLSVKYHKQNYSELSITESRIPDGQLNNVATLSTSEITEVFELQDISPEGKSKLINSEIEKEINESFSVSIGINDITTSSVQDVDTASFSHSQTFVNHQATKQVTSGSSSQNTNVRESESNRNLKFPSTTIPELPTTKLHLTTTKTRSPIASTSPVKSNLPSSTKTSIPSSTQSSSPSVKSSFSSSTKSTITSSSKNNNKTPFSTTENSKTTSTLSNSEKPVNETIYILPKTQRYRPTPTLAIKQHKTAKYYSKTRRQSSTTTSTYAKQGVNVNLLTTTAIPVLKPTYGNTSSKANSTQGKDTASNGGNTTTIYVVTSIIGISLVIGLIFFVYMKRCRSRQRKEILREDKENSIITKKSFTQDIYTKINFRKKKRTDGMNIYDETIPLKDYPEKPASFNDVIKKEFHSSPESQITDEIVCVGQNVAQIHDLTENDTYEGHNATANNNTLTESDCVQIHHSCSETSLTNFKNTQKDNNNNAKLELIDNDVYEKTAIGIIDDSSFDSDDNDIDQPIDNEGNTEININLQEASSNKNNNLVSSGDNENSGANNAVVISEYLIPVCHRHPPQGPNWRPFHAYDPVYVPTSNASAMNRLIDSTGYVSRKRPDSPVFQLYEEINYGEVGSTSPPPLMPRMTMGATASGGKPIRMLPISPADVEPYIATSSISSDTNSYSVLPNQTSTNGSASVPAMSNATNTTNVQRRLPITSPSVTSSVLDSSRTNLSSINIPSRTSRASSSTSKEEMYEVVDFDT